MPVFLCWCLNAVILTFKYRSRDRMCISVFSVIIRIILYTLVTTCRYLYWIIINFLTRLLIYYYYITAIIFSSEYEYYITVLCVITGLITTLYIWHAVARVTPHVETVVWVSILIWVFILFVIFLIYSSYYSLKFTLIPSIYINNLNTRILFST